MNSSDTRARIAFFCGLQRVLDRACACGSAFVVEHDWFCSRARGADKVFSPVFDLRNALDDELQVNPEEWCRLDAMAAARATSPCVIAIVALG